jgi:hypothetical protein
MTMAKIFPKKEKLEPQWKSIYKARMPKRGTSELLRIIDASLGIKDYDREYFVKNVSGNNAVSDAERFVKGFKENIAKIETQYKKFKDWTDKEKSFLTTLVKEMEVEQKFWEERLKELKKKQ